MQNQQHKIEELQTEIEQLRARIAGLEKSEENSRVILNSIGDAVISTDLAGKIRQMNPVAQKLTGWNCDMAIGKPLEDVFRIVNAQTREKADNPVFQILEKGSIVGLANDTVLIAADGSEYQIAGSAAPILSNDKKIIGAVLVFRDVTEEKAFEEEIKISNEVFRTLAANIPGVVYLCRNDEQYSMLYLNETVENVTGYCAEEFLENRISFVDLYHPDDTQGIFKTVDNALAKRESFYLIYRLHHKNGSWRWIEEWGAGVWDGENLRFLEGFLIDITDRRQAEEELRESQERFRRLVERSPDIIYSFSTVRGGSYHSSRVFDILGFTPDQLKEDPKLWEKSIHPDDLPLVLEAVAGTTDGHPINIEYRIRAASGEWRWLHDRSMHLHDNKGELLIEGLVTDITEQVLAGKKLIEAKEKAEKSDHLKSAFINNITHEIRTPLNGILGFGQMMAETDLSIKERMEYFNILQESSNRLMQTVTDFMDISMITSGNMEVYKNSFQLNQLLDELLLKTKNLCSKKDLEIRLEVPEQSDNLLITSDRELIRKALGHLLGNSEKFTQQGSIVFGYEINHERPTFFVKDTGKGIPKDKMKIMFDVFMQGDISVTRGYEGSGLGLSIVKGIITLLGGQIWAESEEGKGTTMYFTLPTPISILKSRSPQLTSARKISTDLPLILIAEDDESNYFFIKVVLEKSGYATLHASNGADAVDLCSRNSEISLVLMDIKMPVMTGIEATRAIRLFKPYIPIIALTAYAQSNDEYRIMEAGCNGFLSKPIKKEELLQMISKLCL